MNGASCFLFPRLICSQALNSSKMEVLFIFSIHRTIIGTWNVAGRLPDENIDIDDWLCTEEPADMYIIGSAHIFSLSVSLSVVSVPIFNMTECSYLSIDFRRLFL